MHKWILGALMALSVSVSAFAQFYGISVDKLALLMQQTQQLPYDNAQIVISSTMGALAENPMGYRKALELAETRLGQPADSLHNEELYIACLQHATNGFVLSNNEKERPRLLLEMALKNRIGTKAADIEFVTPDGKTHRLNEQSERFTLIYFNDPDCDACRQVKQNLEASSVVKEYADNGLLRVISIYPGDNQKLWKKTAYPDWFVNGWDKKQQIEQEETYVMPPTLPVFYLLAPDNTVLVKNEPSLKRIERQLAVAMASSIDAPTLAKQLFNVF